MAGQPLRLLVLATLVLLGNVAAARAEPVPAPTEALKDFDGRGAIQVELPPSAPGTKTEVEAGVMTWLSFRQAYVRPDRMLMELSMGRGGPSQVTLAAGNTERTYPRGAGYVQERVYRNLEAVGESPMATVQMSMTTYARILRDTDSGKILPDEEFDALEKEHKARIEELNKLRQSLSTSQSADDIRKVSMAAAEMARRHDDLLQIPFRRDHPCVLMEFPNKDVFQKLFAHGLAGASSMELLGKGRTRVWITRAEGLPIQIETTANDGHVALSLVFTQISINSGLHPGELTLGAPAGVRLLSATADLKDPNWQEKLDKSLSDQAERLQAEGRPRPPIGPARKRR